MLGDPLSGSKTISLGAQPSIGTYWAPYPLYANLMLCGKPDWSQGGGTQSAWPFPAFDSNGFPIGSTETAIKFLLMPTTASSLTVVSGLYEFSPFGTYNLVSTGTAPFTLHAFTGCTVTLNATTTVGPYTVSNYTVTSTGGANSPGLYVILDMTGGKTCTYAAVFDKYVSNPLQPTLFHPMALSHLDGFKHVRDKDLRALDGSNNNVVDFADFPQSNWCSLDSFPTVYRIQATHLDPYSSGPYCRDGSNQILVTFASSITGKLKPGQIVSLLFPPIDGTKPTPYYHLPFADSTSPSTLMTGQVYPLTDTTAVLKFVLATAGPAIASTDISGLGVYSAVEISGMPAEGTGQLCTAIGGADVWTNFPIACSDACATALGTLYAGLVTSSQTVTLEYGNEFWNYFAGALGFPTYYHCFTMGHEFVAGASTATAAAWNARGTIPHDYYVMRSAQLRALFTTAFFEAGGDPSKIRWVLGSQIGNYNYTTTYLSFAAGFDSLGRPSTDGSFGVPGGSGYGGPIVPDLIGISLYIDVGPANTANDGPTVDGLTLEQGMDLADVYTLNASQTSNATWVAQHLAAIGPYLSTWPHLQLTCYEGGPEAWAVTGSGSTQSKADLMTVAMSLHPRAADQFWAWLRYWQDKGLLAFTKLGINGTFSYDGARIACYNPWIGLEQVAGDGTANLSLLTDGSGKPQAVDPVAVESPIGFAIQQWSPPVALTLTAGTLTASGATKSAITLTWTAATGARGPVTAQLHRSTVSGFTPGLSTMLYGVTTSPYTDTSLAAGTDYYYAVVYQDLASSVTATTTGSTLPDVIVPGTLSAGSTTNSQTTLAWTAPSGGSGTITAQLYRSTVSGFVPPGAGTALSGATASPWTDIELPPATTYYYVVDFVDAIGTHQPSNQVTVTTASESLALATEARQFVLASNQFLTGASGTPINVNNGTTTTGSFSIALWVKPAGTGTMGLASQWSGSWDLRASGGNAVTYISTSGGNVSATALGLTTGSWHFVVFTVSPDTDHRSRSIRAPRRFRGSCPASR